jgi:hypothetical protein
LSDKIMNLYNNRNNERVTCEGIDGICEIKVYPAIATKQSASLGTHRQQIPIS